MFELCHDLILSKTNCQPSTLYWPSSVLVFEHLLSTYSPTTVIKQHSNWYLKAMVSVVNNHKTYFNNKIA